MAQRQLPGGKSAKAVQGTIDRVRCPHCGKPQDFRILSEQQLLDTGSAIFCDFCGGSQIVVRIQHITLVAVKQDPTGKTRPMRQVPGRRQVAAGQQQKPGFFSRLLGKG